MEESGVKEKLEDLIKHTSVYKFDKELLGTVSVRGILRQSDNPNYCILVTSQSDQGDEMLEIELKDVVKHELEEKDEKEGESQGRLHIKTEEVVRKISNGKITDFAGSGQIREELIRKGPKAITELDLMLNFV